MLNHINAYGEMFGGQDVDWAYTSGIEFDMYENVLWREPNDVSFDQHELQQLPNGNYMGFVHEFKDGPIPLGNWTNQFQSIGYIADGITNEIDWVAKVKMQAAAQKWVCHALSNTTNVPEDTTKEVIKKMSS